MGQAVRSLQGERDAGLGMGAGDLPVFEATDARAGHLARFCGRADSDAARVPRSETGQVLLLDVRGAEPHAGR